MEFNFADLFDFTASTGDWMAVIERILFAIADLFKFLGIDLFASEEAATEAVVTDPAIF